ncbi:hypothetical protein PMAYCL1PPCAC_10816, partial [Pristionchus mayeri]
MKILLSLLLLLPLRINVDCGNLDEISKAIEKEMKMNEENQEIEKICQQVWEKIEKGRKIDEAYHEAAKICRQTWEEMTKKRQFDKANHEFEMTSEEIYQAIEKERMMDEDNRGYHSYFDLPKHEYENYEPWPMKIYSNEPEKNYKVFWTEMDSVRKDDLADSIPVIPEPGENCEDIWEEIDRERKMDEESHGCRSCRDAITISSTACPSKGYECDESWQVKMHPN